MKRPLSDSRPLGPFVQGSEIAREVHFFINYSIDASELDGMFQTVEDNINDKLMASHGGIVDGVTMIRDGRNAVEVKVRLNTKVFTDTHEDEIVDSIGRELERVSQSSVEFDTYRYEW